jgi:hypothetical protein
MPSNNLYHLIDDLLNLNQAIEDIRQRLVSLNGVPYLSQDARQVALEAMQCDIGACGNWMRALIGLKGLSQEKYGCNWDAEYRQLLGTGLSSEQIEDLMLNYLRNTITIKVHFTIENLFSDILNALGASPAMGFWHIKNAMLEQAGIPLQGPEETVLSVLAKIRNSYHGNGMCDKYSLSCVIGGLRFEFRPGKPVECASWDHIVVILRATVAVLDAILFSERVSNISGEIPDAFAAQATADMGSAGK